MTTPTAATACPACHAPLTPGARYCHRCGRAAGGGGQRERTAWTIAWVTVILFVVLIIYYVTRGTPAPVGPDMANAGNASAQAGQPPDISQMTPEERFLRLHDRVMAAAGSGDTATAARFEPMAISAYSMIDAPSVDIRYHAAALYTRGGDYTHALALADTIQATAADNLLGDLIRVEVAQARRDRAAEQRATQAFLQHYDRQLSLKRPEYEEHRAMLEDLHRQLQQR